MELNFWNVNGKIKSLGGKPLRFTEFAKRANVPPSTLTRVARGGDTTTETLDRIIGGIFKELKTLAPNVSDEALLKELLILFIKPNLTRVNEPKERNEGGKRQKRRTKKSI